MLLHHQTLPVALNSALSNQSRNLVNQYIIKNTPIWVFADSLNSWEPAVITNTNLLFDRCLFEARCDKKIRSTDSFLAGHGISCHAGFHGIDWFFRDPKDPLAPPAHPRQAYPDLQLDAVFRVDFGKNRFKWGQISLINSANKSFDIEWATQNSLHRYSDRYSFSTLDVVGRFLLLDPKAGFADSPRLKVANLIESGSGIVYRIDGIDTEKYEIIASPVTSVAARNLRIFSRRTLSSSSSNFKLHELTENLQIFEKFPDLADENCRCLVRFNNGMEKISAETHTYSKTATLPAYLELLKKKPRRQLILEQSERPGRQLDRYNRFYVRPWDIISVSKI